MPNYAMLPATDPLHRFQDGARIAGSDRPLPLAGQRISVRVFGGLATVSTERRFRNETAHSIEATITFPVPVHATLLALSARIGDRTIKGIAQARAKARETYETAIDTGKTAVLHEEVLRGVHMLSVGHIPPGTEIAVTDRWAMPMAATARDGVTTLRIPTTVGEIYGRSPLAESDDLATGAVVHEAELEIVTETGTVACGRTTLQDGRARLRLDAPIVIDITGGALRPVRGIAADGRGVTLTVTPAPGGDAALDAELLIDRSGSMNSAVTGAAGSPSKFAVVQAGLREAAGMLYPQDRIGLWEFADRPVRVTPRRGTGFAAAIEALTAPQGGTELGSALAAAAAEAAVDVVLVTDGMSHALDVQALARTGKRFTVILVGADSLEANVGHLAALSGGQLFPVAEADAGRAVRQALATLRAAHRPAAPIEGAPQRVATRIGGMLVEAVWDDSPVDAAGSDSRAIGAVAAALALPRLDSARAAALAEAEGIVCHLTSLVLVDEAGARQEGLPTQHKIPLMQPSVCAPAAAACAMPQAAPVGHAPERRRAASRSGAAGGDFLSNLPGAVAKAAGTLLGAITEIGGPPRDQNRRAISPAEPVARPGAIDWSRDPEALRRGDLTGLPPDLVALLTAAAAHREVQALAQAHGVPPLAVAIALLAWAERDTDRAAARVVRAVLGQGAPAAIDTARRALGW
jgi:Vault protein inter-alpha-trypsin domain/von Willebrand factor type A domain